MAPQAFFKCIIKAAEEKINEKREMLGLLACKKYEKSSRCCCLDEDAESGADLGEDEISA